MRLTQKYSILRKHVLQFTTLSIKENIKPGQFFLPKEAQIKAEAVFNLIISWIVLQNPQRKVMKKGPLKRQSAETKIRQSYERIAR